MHWRALEASCDFICRRLSDAGARLPRIRPCAHPCPFVPRPPSLPAGLKEYPNYMMGGGYVVGGEVARVLVDTHSRLPLKFTPIEDATLGFWLMAMDLRHIDHPRFYTWAAPCCFKAPLRCVWGGVVG